MFYEAFDHQTDSIDWKVDQEKKLCWIKSFVWVKAWMKALQNRSFSGVELCFHVLVDRIFCSRNFLFESFHLRKLLFWKLHIFFLETAFLLWSDHCCVIEKSLFMKSFCFEHFSKKKLFSEFSFKKLKFADEISSLSSIESHFMWVIRPQPQFLLQNHQSTEVCPRIFHLQSFILSPWTVPARTFTHMKSPRSYAISFYVTKMNKNNKSHSREPKTWSRSTNWKLHKLCHYKLVDFEGSSP